MIKDFKIHSISSSVNLKNNIFEYKTDLEFFHFYKGDFYMDGNVFLPINTKLETSLDFFGNFMPNKYECLLNLDENFFDKNHNSFETIDGAFIVGSSINHNYYHAIIDFYSRLFYANKFPLQKIILGNNNFDEVIKAIFDQLHIKNQVIYVDHTLKKYTNSIFVCNKNLEQNVKKYNKYFSDQSRQQSNWTYISRKDSNNRKILNEEEVVHLLIEYGYKIYELSKLSFNEQVKLFNNSKYIVTMHGAGLTNLVFSPKGQTVIEITPNLTNTKNDFYVKSNNNRSDTSTRNHFKEICHINELNHYFYFCNFAETQNNFNNLDKRFTNSDLLVDLNQLKKLIDEIHKSKI